MRGFGQAYLGAYRDKHGHPFDGGKTYRLNVLPNAPARLFWSLTVYDTDARTPVQNKEQIADRVSRQTDLAKNADGSVDLYLGPKAPKGFEKNWIPTVPGNFGMKMIEVQAGLGIGVKKFRTIFVFETKDAMEHFVNNGWEFGGQATAGAKSGGKGGAYQGAVAVMPGVWMYQLTDKGLALELTGKGTKYYKDDDLN